jgi:CubicO group peptidase (beta-lactamase class C family)
LASLEREREPGTYHHYESIDTQVLGMVLTRATGKSLTDYLSEKFGNLWVWSIKHTGLQMMTIWNSL